VVLQWLKFDVSTADDFVVTFDGTLLDETKTLSALGIGDVAVLFIERRGNNGFQDPPFDPPNLSTIKDIGSPQGSNTIGSNWAE
jgi:hypothetical protein